jgi:hypothetical protein
MNKWPTYRALIEYVKTEYFFAPSNLESFYYFFASHRFACRSTDTSLKCMIHGRVERMKTFHQMVGRPCCAKSVCESHINPLRRLNRTCNNKTQLASFPRHHFKCVRRAEAVPRGLTLRNKANRSDHHRCICESVPRTEAFTQK